MSVSREDLHSVDVSDSYLCSLTQAIRQFAQQLDEWLTESLSHLPEPLQKKKLAG